MIIIETLHRTSPGRFAIVGNRYTQWNADENDNKIFIGHSIIVPHAIEDRVVMIIEKKNIKRLSDYSINK